MSRYIDADALKEKFTSKWILDRIDQHPTADVVEVVRCKDCIFWQTDWIPNHGGDQGCHYCEMMDTFTEPLNYCGCAERKILPKP